MAKQWTREQQEKATKRIEDANLLSAEHSPSKEWLDVAVGLQCELTEAAELLEHAGIPPIFSTIAPAARWNEKRNAWLARNRKEDA